MPREWGGVVVELPGLAFRGVDVQHGLSLAPTFHVPTQHRRRLAVPAQSILAIVAKRNTSATHRRLVVSAQ